MSPLAPRYTTSHEAMAAGAATVENATHDIRAVLATLRGDADAMLAGWRGEAAGAFAGVLGAFESRADQIVGALQQMHDALLRTDRAYTAQEAEQTRSLTSLTARINA